MRVSSACLFSLIALLLGGCVSTNTPGDLTFLSVQVVDWRDRAELPGPGASPVIGMVSNRDVLASGQSLTGGEKSHRSLLKVEFTSATDLPKLAIENAYNLRNKTFFCDRPKTSPIMAFSYIFWRGVRLGEHEADPIEQQGEPTASPVTYYIFIDVARQKVVPSTPPAGGIRPLAEA